MAKINIVKPTGSEMLSLLSAFKVENLTYAIFDSEKVGSMGLPIIYIAKLTEKLEKVIDDNEWQSVKNSLKGIINGTNYEYVKIPETLNADEVFYTPLTLPQSSFDIIKSRYVVEEVTAEKELEQLSPISPNNSVPPVENMNNIPNREINNINTNREVVSPAPVQNEVPNSNVNVSAVQPVMPSVNAQSNVNYTTTPSVTPPVQNIPNLEVGNMPKQPEKVEVPKEEVVPKFDPNIFMQDKETFLKACENMFDALVSKYQKQLDDLERREQQLKIQELEVQTKLNDATEHLANAAAREQVANIAHDNAQKVMDLNNFMPSNPATNQ